MPPEHIFGSLRVKGAEVPGLKAVAVVRQDKALVAFCKAKIFTVHFCIFAYM